LDVPEGRHQNTDGVITKMFENPDSPIITPSAFVLGVNRLRKKKIHSKRMVDHIIKTTIGQATLPPEGRGSKSMLSPKDVALGIEGLALLDLRLPPGFVVRCTRAIREAWNDIFPPPFLNETLKALVSSSSPSPLEQLEKLPKRFLFPHGPSQGRWGSSGFGGG
jgi:hypothetical protein